jgi:hypothetical protein
MAKPAGVTFTAWLWIVTGGLMVFSAVLGGLAYSMMRQRGGLPAPLLDIPSEFALTNSVSQGFGVLLALQCVVALVAVWAGIALLQLQAWARTTIEVLCWVSLVSCVGFGIYGIYLWVSITGHIATGGLPFAADILQIIGAVVGAIVTVAFAVPFWIMIRYLRGAEVRTAIAGTQEARGCVI